jgi:hypothetical protein
MNPRILQTAKRQCNSLMYFTIISPCRWLLKKILGQDML